MEKIHTNCTIQILYFNFALVSSIFYLFIFSLFFVFVRVAHMLGILTQALLPKFSIAPIVDGFFLFEFLRPNWFHFFATYYAIRSESFVRIFSHLLYHFVVLCSVWFFFLFFFYICLLCRGV